MVVKEHGTPRAEAKLYNHVDLVQLLDIVDLEKGTVVAGADAFLDHPIPPGSDQPYPLLQVSRASRHGDPYEMRATLVVLCSIWLCS